MERVQGALQALPPETNVVSLLKSQNFNGLHTSSSTKNYIQWQNFRNCVPRFEKLRKYCETAGARDDLNPGLFSWRRTLPQVPCRKLVVIVRWGKLCSLL